MLWKIQSMLCIYSTLAAKMYVNLWQKYQYTSNFEQFAEFFLSPYLGVGTTLDHFYIVKKQSVESDMLKNLVTGAAMLAVAFSILPEIRSWPLVPGVQQTHRVLAYGMPNVTKIGYFVNWIILAYLINMPQVQSVSQILMSPANAASPMLDL